MRRRAVLVVLGLLATVTTAGCGDVAQGRNLTLGTGNNTGVYSVLGRGYAGLVGQRMSGYSMTAQVTNGPEQNIERIVSGQDDVGLSSLSWASDAITGQGVFRTPQPIRALVRLYLNYMTIVVRSDIHDVTGLRGRTISTGSPGSTGELAAARLLGLAGMDVDKDTQRVKMSLPDSVDRMKAGRLDALFWSGGLPTAGVKDLMRTLGRRVTVLDLSGYYQRMIIAYPDVYVQATIPPAAYGQPRPVRTIAEPNLLLVRDSMDTQVAQQLTAVLMDNLPALAEVHPEGGNITRAKAEMTDPIPLHSGALHWYQANPLVLAPARGAPSATTRP
jgi:TRAP transporter TAXI family solute receptor